MGHDQNFLTNYIWNQLKSDILMVHDNFFNYNEFTNKLENLTFDNELKVYDTKQQKFTELNKTYRSKKFLINEINNKLNISIFNCNFLSCKRSSFIVQRYRRAAT